MKDPTYSNSCLFPTLLACALCVTSSGHSFAAEPVGKLFDLSSAQNQTILSVKHDQLRVRYFGSKLLDPTDAVKGSEAGPLEFPTFWDAAESRIGREYAYSVRQADGYYSSQLEFVSGSVEAIDENQNHHRFEYRDPDYGTVLIRHYIVSRAESVVETWSELEHGGPGEITVERLASGYLQLDATAPHLASFQGNWSREAHFDEQPLLAGVVELGSERGTRTAQDVNPSFVLSLDGPGHEDHGRVLLGSVAWSGNWEVRVRKHIDETVEVVAGYNPAHSSYALRSGERLTTPRFIYAYSESGKGAASRNLHRWARRYGIEHGNEERPILLNSWEGARFDFDEPLLKGMMERASAMGVELFVLDDGWFGNGEFARNSARAGLGDWQVNTEKLPNGIEGLVEVAQGLGLDFGLWFEPEMVNPRSQLYQDHPEWAIQLPERPHRMSRNQLVLDLSRPEVQEHVFESVDRLLTEVPGISYVKWDANSHIIDPGSVYQGPQNQSHLWFDYVNGYYAVLERLTEKHPDVLFQACSSGGGRIDYGAMQFHDEFWASDNTDALERLRMQWSLGHFFPAIAMGSHVTEVPNQQTGRTTPLKFRFDVAMTGRLGFELDPHDLTEEESAFSKAGLETYKRIRPVIQFGDLFRLRSPHETPDPALMYVSGEKERAVVFCYLIEKERNQQFAPVRLKGLKPEGRYRIREVNRQSERAMSPLEDNVVSGDYLMKAGLDVRWTTRAPDFQSCVFELVEE